MEFIVRGTVQIDEPTLSDLRFIRARIRNLLMDFGHDINVVVDFSPTEIRSGTWTHAQAEAKP